MKLKRILNVIKSLLETNLFATILFNFKVFDLKSAIRLPVFLYGKVDYSGCTGQIKRLREEMRPHVGGWRIGIGGYNSSGRSSRLTVLSIEGTLYLGEHGRIANGCLLNVRHHAICVLEDRVDLNECCKIRCHMSVKIGKGTQFAWECQVYDTNFHYMVNLVDRTIQNINKPIEIGDYCWFGNRVNVARGTILPAFSIVGSCSLVNKDFSNYPNCIFAGIPATVKKSNYMRVFHKIRQYYELEPWFLENPHGVYKIGEDVDLNGFCL